MADISFTNLTNLPPDIATELENINRKRRIQDALMAQTLQQGQTQMTGGRYSRAVPYSPLEGATKLIQAAMLSKQSDKNNAALRGLGQRYTDESGEVVRNMQAQATGGVPWREPDPQGAITTGAGSVYPEGRRVAEAMMNAQRMGGNRARPTGSTEGYFTMGAGGQPNMVRSPDTGEPLMPVYADPAMRQRYSGAGERGKQDVLIQTDPVKKREVLLAEREAEKLIEKPKIEKDIETQDVKFDLLDSSIDTAIEQASGFTTTGFIGQITSGIGGMPAHDLQGTLETIKSNIGFDRLQEMRANSPTGGALGQVSEMENKLLQSVWGALNQSQTEDQFVKNLEAVRAQTKESWKRILDAYEKDYGVPYKSPEKPSEPNATGFDDADKERRYQEWKARQ